VVAKFLIPKLCAALKRENPDYSNYDIREIVEKDCIEIWQKATIRDALPDEYKEKMRQEQARMSHTRYETGSEQALLLLTKAVIIGKILILLILPLLAQ
jgi:hypothetical protein